VEPFKNVKATVSINFNQKRVGDAGILAELEEVRMQLTASTTQPASKEAAGN
jgi:hypothetical protein